MDRQSDGGVVCVHIYFPFMIISLILGWGTADIVLPHWKTVPKARHQYHTQSQYTDTGPISPSSNLLMLDAYQESTNFHFIVFGMTRPGFEPRTSCSLGRHPSCYTMEVQSWNMPYQKKLKYAIQKRDLKHVTPKKSLSISHQKDLLLFIENWPGRLKAIDFT